MNPVEDNPADGRFELAIENSYDIAAVYYRVERDNIVLNHTIVPERFSGRGIGEQLARGVFDAIRASGRKALLVCPFMAYFQASHPEYSDIVATENGEAA